MKTKLLILILLFAGQFAKSQTFSKKSSWTELRTKLSDPTFFETTTYRVDGDTLMDGKNYSKLFVNNKFFAGLRETGDNKIYVHFPEFNDFFNTYFPDSDRELLIYDFGWFPGKILYHQTMYETKEINGTAWPSLDSTVQAVLGGNIDSAQLLDGKYYQRVQSIGTIIRGIGSTLGFFFYTFDKPTDGSQFSLLCFHIDGVLVYRNPGYTSCDISTASAITIRDAEVKLYPNPSNDVITVEFPDGLNVDTFKIFDAKGVLIKAYELGGKNRLELNLQTLAKGVYVYAAISKNNQKASGKIIVK